MRRGTAATLVLLLSSAIVGTAAASASAHALLASSSPSANETLDRAPTRLMLTFTEPPDPTLSVVHLLGDTGIEVDLGPARVTGRTITIPIASTPRDGVYTVSWRVVSRTDGHVTAGSFAFGIGVAPPPATAGSGQQTTYPPPSVPSIVSKWLLYASLAILLAGAVVVVSVLRVEEPPRWPYLAAAAGAILGWIGFVAAQASTIGVTAFTFLSSEAGVAYVWLGIAIAAAAVSVIAWAVMSRRTIIWAVALFATGAMLARAIGGHADAGRLSTLEVTAQFAHLLAVGVWIGGVIWLLALLPRIESPRRAAAVRRFSTTAGIALAVVAVTGALRAVDELGGLAHLDRLFDTGFGWTLLAKVGVSLLLIAAGAWNRYVNVPRVAEPGGELSLRRVLTAEACLAAGIFGLTGLLTGLPPALSSTPPTRPAGPLVVEGSDFATSVRARLEISPGTVGANRFVARVVDYDTGRDVAADRVSIRFTPLSSPDLPPSTLRLHPSREGRWSGRGTGLSIDDRWQLILTVETASGSTQVPLEVSPHVPGGRLEVAEGQPTLYTTTFDDGTSIQSYVDPGISGPNRLHATAFDEKGHELPLRRISLIAIPPDGEAIVLEPIRFSAGHFAANASLASGRWRFEIRALARDERPLDARFDQTIAGQGG